MDENDSLDLNNDGMIDQYELEIFNKKTKTQRWMAIGSFVTIIMIGSYITFFMPETRLLALSSGVLDVFWITLGGIVATYMGYSAFIDMTKRKGGGYGNHGGFPRYPRNPRPDYDRTEEMDEK